MPTLLRIDSSADVNGSRTRVLTAAVADAWKGRSAAHSVVTRDVHADPLPHLQSPAQHWPLHLRNGEPVPAGHDELQRTVLDELVAADALVIGAPMYNYTMPSTLKTWIDLIHIPGLTTPFGDDATQPLKGKPAVIVTARGAIYEPGGPRDGWDHGVPPLVLVFREALGMDVSVVQVERTLADLVPALDKDKAAEELSAAVAEAARLGSTI